MGTIYDYLKWRGDLGFSERPFCEVDNLVLAELSYLDFSGIIPTVEEGGSITLEDAAEEFRQQEKKSVAFCSGNTPIVLCMAETRRFRQVKLSNYVDVSDEQTQTQFAALHIELGDGTTYVASRGTGNDLVGWREDFSMSFQLMPAQKSAADYLTRTLCNPNMQYRIGGHSKGGNLAVYAAMQYPAEKQQRIIEIYNNDGPGMCEDIVDMAKYQNISSKIIRIVPEFSIIGALFEQGGPTKIVSSSADGFMQHDGHSWQIEGDHFCEKPALSEKCRFINGVFDTWLESASMAQREAFTNDFFGALEASGAKSISDLSHSGIGEIETILTAITTQSAGKTKVAIGKLVASVFHAFRNFDFKKLLKMESAIQGAVCLVIGLFFMMAPNFATRSIGMGLGLAALYWLGKRLLANAFSGEADAVLKKRKLLFYMAAMCLVSFLIAKSSLMLRFTNLFVGVFFLVAAFKQLCKGITDETQIAYRVLHLLAGGILFMLGMIPMVLLGLEFTPYAGIAGACFFLYGIVRLVYSMYKNGKQNAGES